MNVKNAKHPRDIVLTCYICDDQYTGDRIGRHLEECKYDWNIEEVDKPKHERIPLPKPTSEFSKLMLAVQQLDLKPAPDQNEDLKDVDSNEEQEESGKTFY